MAIFARCQLCGQRLPLFSRKDYCSQEHQKLDQDHQRSLYLARLAENTVEVRRLTSAFEHRLQAEGRKP